MTIVLTINRTPPLDEGTPKMSRHWQVFGHSYGLSFGARINRWYTVVRLDTGIPRPMFPVTSLKNLTKGEPNGRDARPSE